MWLLRSDSTTLAVAKDSDSSSWEGGDFVLTNVQRDVILRTLLMVVVWVSKNTPTRRS